VIVAAAPPLPVAEAARRAAGGRLAAWLASPGDGDLAIERQFVACDPVAVVRGSSVEALEEAWREQRHSWGGRPEVPIGIGFLSYDLGRQFERLRGSPPPPSPWPDLEFRFYDALWVCQGDAGAEIWARDEAAAARLAARLALDPGPAPAARLEPLVPLEPASRHLEGVRRVLEYLRAGDVYQVNLARRLCAPVGGEAPIGWALFERLQSDSPAPHAVWLPGEDGSCVIGNSPERFLRAHPDGRVETRPIKGTRPRDGDAAELARHPKDLAEHIMIVDLERNDLGRVCVTGSVEVAGFARTVSLPTVHHLVTTVRGVLRPGIGLGALLRATFPGGSITGAPKIRAMEIIDELEAARRGPYCGATGWLGAAGDLDLSVAIRTALVYDGRMTLWVGGGVVADSSPEAELAETEVKAVAFARLTRGGGAAAPPAPPGRSPR
jgi:para-aminobenzoate synthetase component 1